MIHTITVAKRDGIGPEISDTELSILHGAQFGLACEQIAVGEKVDLSSKSDGYPAAAVDTLRYDPVCLPVLMDTPQGIVAKSLLVTIRKRLDLFANAAMVHLGRTPSTVVPLHAKGCGLSRCTSECATVKREPCGMDMPMCDTICPPDHIAHRFLKTSHGMLKRNLITNCGVMVRLEGVRAVFFTDL